MGRGLFWRWTILTVSIIYASVYFLTEILNYTNSFNFCAYIIIAWIGAAGCVKRLHDMDQSSWTFLLFLIPASITYSLSFLNYDRQLVIASGYFTFLIGLWISIKIGIIKGTSGANKFTIVPDTTPSNYLRPIMNLINRFNSNNSDPNNRHRINQNIEGSSEEKSIPINNIQDKSDVLDNWLSKVNPDKINDDPFMEGETEKNPLISGSDPTTIEPEILRATGSVFDKKNAEPTDLTSNQEGFFEAESQSKEPSPSAIDNNLNARLPEIKTFKKESSIPEQTIETETDRFFKIMRKRSTNSPIYQLYLQNSAEAGNSWAKLEIAATWLNNINTNKDRAQQAINYLGELANSSQSHLGAETEAAYFLGEIYRIGLRFTRPNEDLSFKYLIRAAALGHKSAQLSLKQQIVQYDEDQNNNSAIQSLIKKALIDKESAKALMLLIELDWSITYIESINLIIRTLVDQGNGRAAKFLGRILIEQKDYETGVRVLNLADELDNITIDKIIEIIKEAQSPEGIINSFVDIIKKHADLGNSYANYQIALAFNEGVGVPQDNVMAYVHVTIASARVYGHERDQLIKLKDELRKVLSEDEILYAQKIIRQNYTK